MGTMRSEGTASAEEARRLAQRLIDDAFNGRNLDVLDELIAPDFVEHSPPLFPDAPPGAERLRADYRALFAAFPDVRAHVTHLFTEGNMVAIRDQITGTHAGPFNGIPASQNRVDYQVFHIYRVAGGRLAEHWGQVDTDALLRQIGAERGFSREAGGESGPGGRVAS